MKLFNEKIIYKQASHNKIFVMKEMRAGQNLELERIHITIDIVQTYKYQFPLYI